MKLKHWFFGIIGGTIVGFHLLMVMICENTFRWREPWTWRAMTWGMFLWFYIDSVTSWYLGAVHYILLINLPALVLIGVPLVMTQGVFWGAGAGAEKGG